MTATANRLRIAGYQPPATVNSRAIRHFASLIDSADPAEVPAGVEVIGNILELGLPTSALLDKVADGTFDMATTTSIHFHKWVPELAAFDIPFLVASRERARDVLDRGIAPLLDGMDGLPVRILAIWDNGVRQISNSVRPIHAPEDCAGLRLRTQRSPLITRAMGLVGFEAVALDIGRLRDAIANGEIDAQENPLINIHGFGIDKMHRHIALTEHLCGVSFLVCNHERWRTWPLDQRDQVAEAAKRSSVYQRALAAEEDVRLRQEMAAAGTAFTEIGADAKRAFQSKIDPVRDEYRELLARPALRGLADA